jgi:hypothetical protein
MKKLIYWQRLQLRDEICKIRIDELSEERNYELQGQMLFKLGFNEIEAKYPSDTWVGGLRLSGYMHVWHS